MIDVDRSVLVFVDFQTRLMPVIDDGDAVISAAVRLQSAAALLDVRCAMTEQYPKGLGHTVEALASSADTPVIEKMCFGAANLPGLEERLDARSQVVVAGCETHVCVLQTVLGLRAQAREIYVVADAVGSRRVQDHKLGLERMARHGAELVTSEMVLFEWLRSADHPLRRDVLALIR